MGTVKARRVVEIKKAPRVARVGANGDRVKEGGRMGRVGSWTGRGPVILMTSRAWKM